MESNGACFFSTSMFGKMGEPPAFFVLQVDVPGACEEARCNGGIMPMAI